MRIILCGGGTAGHVNPAIAIAQEIKAREKGSKFLFIGRWGGRENELVTKAGFPITALKVSGLRRKITAENIKAINQALAAKVEARRIIEKFEPDVVVGTGGYVCWPVISAAKKLNIPTVIHESNVTPGLTTRLLAKKCTRVLVSSEETVKLLPKVKSISVVGNPLLKAFKTAKKEDARKILGLLPGEKLIVSFGGSLGAEKLNSVITEVMKNYSAKEYNVNHIHAAGKKYFTDIKNKEIKFSEGCKIIDYIYNMPTMLHAADIVICRGGAMTITEISAAKAAAIIIPSPNVAENHQLKNAQILSKRGAALVIEETDLSEEVLTGAIKDLLENEEKRKTMSKCIQLFAKSDAEKRIYDEIKSIVKA